MVDGTIYTGSCPYKQWISKEVVLRHDAICASRKQGSGENTNKGSMMKRKAELCAQISYLESTKRRMISNMKSIPLDDEKLKSGGGGIVSGSSAGTLFGECVENSVKI